MTVGALGRHLMKLSSQQLAPAASTQVLDYIFAYTYISKLSLYGHSSLRKGFLKGKSFNRFSHLGCGENGCQSHTDKNHSVPSRYSIRQSVKSSTAPYLASIEPHLWYSAGSLTHRRTRGSGLLD